MSDLAIDSLDKLSSIDTLPPLGLVDKDRPLTPAEYTTDKIAQMILNRDPTIATIGFGMQFEAITSEKLRKLEDKATGIMQSIDHLLDLSQELASVNDAAPVLAEKALEIIEKLREQGISLMDKGATLTKEQLITIKSNISLRIDKLRTEVHQVFTKIQTLIQYMSSINATVKEDIAKHDDFTRKVNERSIKR